MRQFLQKNLDTILNTYMYLGILFSMLSIYSYIHNYIEVSIFSIKIGISLFALYVIHYICDTLRRKMWDSGFVPSIMMLYMVLIVFLAMYVWVMGFIGYQTYLMFM